MYLKTLHLSILLSIVIALSVAMLLFGNHTFSLRELLQMTSMSKSDYFILYDVRLPRLITNLYCGMLFALAGSIFQVIYKNPVASPDILGVNATTIFTVLLFSNLFGTQYGLLGYALIGAAVGFALTITLSIKDKKINPIRLIIIGVSISILFKALSQLLVIQSKESIHNVLYFLNGSLYQVSWESVSALTYPTIILIAGCLLFSRYLDVIELHAYTVKSIGLNLRRWQVYFIALALLMSAVAVSASGSLGFIGLIAPNIARLLFGYSHRYNLYGSLLIGCILTLAADLIGRVIFYPFEIPAGIIMIFIGTPIFILFLKKINGYHYG